MTGNLRKELKFILGVEEAMRLRAKLRLIMTPDPHGVCGKYGIRSQYFDSLREEDLKDNLDGLMEKRKIRVRVYSSKRAGAKLEYKCKKGSEGLKYSLLLSEQEVLFMEQHRYDFLLERKEALAGRLYTKMTQQVYRPKTIIEYDRTAFLYPINDIRITFDKNVRASANPMGILEKEIEAVYLLPPEKEILEIKYQDFFPYALKEVFGNLDHMTEAYSKYTVSRLKFI